MAFDRDLADDIREVLASEEGVTEQRMFGGLAFLINGHIGVAASRQGGLMVRVPPEDSDAYVDDERVRPMTMRGREMHGWLHVDTAAADAAGYYEQLEQWVRRSVTYARSLPIKSTGRRRRTHATG